jgi:hypothetical protein
MNDPHDDPALSPRAIHRKRERSTRYPGVDLAESVKLCESIDELGLDGRSSSDIASALGYKNIKTNTFSARLSAARQFGLLTLTDEGYELTPLAREILHPVDPAERPRLFRRALFNPPLYAELAERMADKRVPEAELLGNLLYHHHKIIASAKHTAAEAFLESARFAGALGEDQVLRPNGLVPAKPTSDRPLGKRAVGTGVRIDLRLWDEDEGKTIRVRAPDTITAASFERFLQAFRLLVRIEEKPSDPQ